MSRCDLHVHSRHSARSEEWLFRRFDLPDSYSDPTETYGLLREAGMDFVTITDHDTIDGALEIADKPHTFLSEQVTTYFPQDPCKIHILVWALSEAQHRDISALRENIFDLQGYLQQQGLAHAVAHPLYSINGKLEATHLERLILLFKHFEGLNGLRDKLLSDLIKQILSGLTPEKIEELANRHGFAPTHSEPWQKIIVAGQTTTEGSSSPAPFTETPPRPNARGVPAHLQAGGAPSRRGWNSPRLSHGFYNTLGGSSRTGSRSNSGQALRCSRRCSPVSWKGAIRRSSRCVRRRLRRAGCSLRENLRAGEAEQRLALERAVAYFAQPEVKARSRRRRMARSRRSGGRS
jgi:hypothetical protein